MASPSFRINDEAFLASASFVPSSGAAAAAASSGANNRLPVITLHDFAANGLLDSSSGVLQRALEVSKKQQALSKPITTVRFVEHADIVVPSATDNHGTSEVAIKPATLRSGELVAYTPEELLETKDSEFAFGRRLHVYRGQLRPGSELREGRGVFQYADGETFIGDFRSNRRNGWGVLLVPTGYGFEGLFKDDKANGPGRELFPCGSTLTGNYEDGLPSGLCVLATPRNGSVFVGQFVAGERHGHGIIVYDNGDSAAGTWVHGKRDGTFQTWYADKRRLYATTWRGDSADVSSKFVGEGFACRPSLPDLSEFPLLPAPDIRAVGIVPDLVSEVHPLLVLMLREGFHALHDAEQADGGSQGTVELAVLREQWITDAAASNARRGMAASLRAYRESDTADLLSKLEIITKNGVNIDFADVLTVCFPHLPATEVRRWANIDLIQPEVLLRLRGVLGPISLTGARVVDTWQAVAGAANGTTLSSSSASPSSKLKEQQQLQMQQQDMMMMMDGDGAGGAGAGGSMRTGSLSGPVTLAQMYCSNINTLGGVVRLSRTLFLRAHCAALKKLPREQSVGGGGAMHPSNAPRHLLKGTSPSDPAAPLVAGAMPSKDGGGSLQQSESAGHYHQQQQHHHHPSHHHNHSHNFSLVNNPHLHKMTAAERVEFSRAAMRNLVIPLHIYTPSQLQSLTATFSDILAQIFPLSTADERLHMELDTIPEPILGHYALYFDAIDTDNTHYISIERLKGAQQRYRTVNAASNPDKRIGTPLRALLLQEQLRKFPLAEYFAVSQQQQQKNNNNNNNSNGNIDFESGDATGLPPGVDLSSLPPEAAAAARRRAQQQQTQTKERKQSGYESRLQPCPQMPWVAKWTLLDIALTVSSARNIDKQRTGFLSLAEILRYSFPSVPCAWTRDRLTGGSVAAAAVAAQQQQQAGGGGPNNNNNNNNNNAGNENAAAGVISCRCSICRFCGARYTKLRPQNPYLDGTTTW